VGDGDVVGDTERPQLLDLHVIQQHRLGPVLHLRQQLDAGDEASKAPERLPERLRRRVVVDRNEISQQAVSEHLQVLRETGLVVVRPQGQRRLYVVRPEGLESVRDFLGELWPTSLERLKRTVEAD
jgi:DNA-binding transcriptional ArsR family regulator